MSLKLKTFNNFSNVQNVNDADKRNAAPICIDLDDDSDDKEAHPSNPSEESADTIVKNPTSNGGSEELSTSRELVVYSESDDPSICKDGNEDGVNLHNSVIVVDNDGVAVVDPSICKDGNDAGVTKDGRNDSIIVDNDGVDEDVDDPSICKDGNDAGVTIDCLNDSIIVVDNDGVAVVKKKTELNQKKNTAELNTDLEPLVKLLKVNNVSTKPLCSDKLQEDQMDSVEASVVVVSDLEINATNREVNVAPTIVLEEDTSSGDVVQVHEISVDGDIVHVQEIAFDEKEKVIEHVQEIALDETDNISDVKDKTGEKDKVINEKLRDSVEDINQPVIQDVASEDIADIDQTDEIVIISDKESSSIEEQNSKPTDGIEQETVQKLRKISEHVTVLKAPLQRIKKNKRMIKSPFKRTNDLLCQKVDKMIRCGEPDIQLLRSLLNHLSENNIGGLLAKLVSSLELETMRANFETALVKDETMGNKVSTEASADIVEDDEKAAMPNASKENPELAVGKDSLQKKANEFCSKLPEGITVAVVSSAQAEVTDSGPKVVNSIDMIDNIIQSEVSAAQSSGKSGLPIRCNSIVELDVSPPSTPAPTPTPI
eukprot:GFUD01033722.1.p1 GENE.GFUD01033722.1~~GFUD01033722.1.p1  ORF type:complete len:599 (+),score=180.84 GFUD01033722.1:51-1847(+)